MNSIENTLSTLIKKNKNLKKVFDNYYINKKWSEIVNKEIADKTYVSTITDSTIHILTSSSVWSNQLNLLQKQIIESINSTITDKKIKKIRFSTSSLKKINQYKDEIFDHKRIIKKNATYTNGIEKITEIGDNLDLEMQDLVNRIYTKDKNRKQNGINEKWIKCRICNSFSKNKEDICPICLSKIETENEKTVLKSVFDTPWIKYTEFRKDNKVIKESFFISTKKKYTDQLYLDINNKTFQYMKTKEKSLLNSIKKEIQTFVMLKTMLEPQNITDIIVKKKIGKFIYGNIMKQSS
jgi:hypothetical protein